MTKMTTNIPVHITTKFAAKEMEEEDSILIEGFANTANKDRQGDVILEEAWAKGGLDNYLKNPIVLAFHNPERPIGEVTEHSISNDGLRVVAKISKAAGDVYKLIKEGVLKAFSVGFMVKDADYNSETDIFVIKDLELFELSVVSIPANADSIFSIKKSFDNEKDYMEFKNLYTKTQEDSTIVEELDIEGEEIVDKDKISLTPAELKKLEEEAVKKALANKAAEEAKAAAAAETIKNVSTEVVSTAEERILGEVEKRLSEKDSNLETTLEGLRAELKEKSDEIVAMQRSKMEFVVDKNKPAIPAEEKETAVLAAKILGVPLEKTRYFKDIVTKAGGDHVQGLGGLDGTSPEDWENLFSTNLYQDVKDKTIVEPMFNKRIQMTSRTLVFPWNPEAGFAEWVPDTQYKSVAADDPNSTGAAAGQEHLIKDNVLKAEKLASKEFIGYEEEEDSIIPLTPIIRDAVMRRMVRSTDVELLRGNVGANLGSGNGLIDGVSTLAGDVGYAYTQPGTFGSANPVTVADLQQTRRMMGVYGLMPGDVTYVVSQTVMYDLMDDPDFRTVDVVGENATILRGQIGSINGSPVVVSDSFVAYATGTVQAIAINTSNYLFGELRGMTVERDRDIIHQKNVLVATRRFAFSEIVPAVTYVDTTSRSACANLVTA